ncbi:putative signal transducing protein [Photobacterium ganghwense]|uniref:putative signal transducing protein n=1 Tax=Photobacterium ganghwense TaxID=320778 RepID=UPI001C2DE69F|nr:DUF2007 domain-containing protein [Photobacterium ganghwense]MBV1841252.1 DUF2007 domain-containing protein [Photobacterium ganghwense]
MKVVARFSFPHEAHLAKTNLEAAGIESTLADEHTVNMQWLYSDAIGGVRLLVEDSDANAALTILQADFSECLDDGANAFEADASGVTAAGVRASGQRVSDERDSCPCCGSTQLVPYTKGKKPAFVVFMLLGFPLFFYQHGYQCKSCGAFSKVLDKP